MSEAETAAAARGRTREGGGLLEAAVELASGAHADQTRKDGSAFIGHPRAVSEILAAAGFDQEVRAAALLHDVVEDSEIEQGEIQRRFGPRVAELVAAMTEDPTIEDYHQRKRAQRQRVEAAGTEAVAIYAADKLSNVRDTRRGYEREGETIRHRFQVPLDDRIAIWREDLEMASRFEPRLPYLRELRYELESLEEQRAKANGA